MVTIPSATFSSTDLVRASLSRKRSADRLSSPDLRNSSTKTLAFARRMSGTIGAKMKSTAPLWYAVGICASSAACAVMKMIGVCSDSRRMRTNLAVS